MWRERLEEIIQEEKKYGQEINSGISDEEAVWHMGMFLNSKSPYEEYRTIAKSRFFVDKSAMIDELLLSCESLGYIHNLAKASEKMLKATLAGDTGTMAEILKFAHDTESPILAYNSEIELSAAVNLVYLAARDKYRVEREDKAGKG